MAAPGYARWHGRCDYDGRTGLMLATAHGHLDVVHSLLAAGAVPSLQDNLGGSALSEACKNGHDVIIPALREAGAECVPPGPCLRCFYCPFCLLRNFMPSAGCARRALT